MGLYITYPSLILFAECGVVLANIGVITSMGVVFAFYREFEAVMFFNTSKHIRSTRIGARVEMGVNMVPLPSSMTFNNKTTTTTTKSNEQLLREK